MVELAVDRFRLSVVRDDFEAFEVFLEFDEPGAREDRDPIVREPRLVVDRLLPPRTAPLLDLLEVEEPDRETIEFREFLDAEPDLTLALLERDWLPDLLAEEERGTTSGAFRRFRRSRVRVPSLVPLPRTPEPIRFRSPSVRPRRLDVTLRFRSPSRPPRLLRVETRRCC